MKKNKWEDGRDFREEDGDFLSDTIENEIEKRFKHLCADDRYGVMHGYIVNVPNLTTVTVSAGVALTASGVLVESTTLLSIVASTGNADKYLVLLVEVEDSDETGAEVAHPDTGVVASQWEKYTVSIGWYTEAAIPAEGIRLGKQTSWHPVDGAVITVTVPTHRDEWSSLIGANAISGNEIESIAASKVTIADIPSNNAGITNVELHAASQGTGTPSTSNAHALRIGDLDSYKADLARLALAAFNNGVVSRSGLGLRPTYGGTWGDANLGQVQFQTLNSDEGFMVAGRFYGELQAFTGTWSGDDSGDVVADRPTYTRFTQNQQSASQDAWYIGYPSGPVTRYVYVDSSGVLQCQSASPFDGPAGDSSYDENKLFLAKVTFDDNGPQIDMTDFPGGTVGAYGEGVDMRKFYVVTESMVAGDPDEPQTYDPTTDPLPDSSINDDLQPLYDGVPITLRAKMERIRNMIRRIVWAGYTESYDWNTTWNTVVPTVMGLWGLTKKFQSNNDEGHSHTGVAGEGPQLYALNVIATKPTGGAVDYEDVQDHISHVGSANPTLHRPHGAHAYDAYFPTKVSDWSNLVGGAPGISPLGDCVQGDWIRLWFMTGTGIDLSAYPTRLYVDHDRIAHRDGMETLMTSPPNLNQNSYQGFFYGIKEYFQGIVQARYRVSGLAVTDYAPWMLVGEAGTYVYAHRSGSYTTYRAEIDDPGMAPICYMYRLPGGAQNYILEVTFKLPFFKESGVGANAWALDASCCVVGLGPSFDDVQSSGG